MFDNFYVYINTQCKVELEIFAPQPCLGRILWQYLHRSRCVPKE